MRQRSLIEDVESVVLPTQGINGHRLDGIRNG
jgi:hypothetical protein